MNSFATVQGIEELAGLLDRGHLLVTVNRRLSRHLTRRLNTFKAFRGQAVWTSLAVIPLQAWMATLWLECLDGAEKDGKNPPRMLSNLAIRYLWERIVAEDLQGTRTILWPRRAAALAREAFDLLVAWRLPPPEGQSLGQEDCETFIRWRKKFLARLTRGGWIIPSLLPKYVAGRLDRIRWPEGIVLAGFDSWTPENEQFFSLLQRHGVFVTRYLPEPERGTPVFRLLADHEGEIMAAARWAKGWIDRERSRATVVGELSVDGGAMVVPPGRVIGIIHPELARWRRQVIRIFTEVFHPGGLVGDALPEEPVFNVSMGFALADHPMIADARFLLHLAFAGRCTLEEASRLLLCPHCLGGRAEYSFRGRLDRKWRESGWRRVSLEHLRAMAVDHGSVPQLVVLLDAVIALVSGAEFESRKQPPRYWSRRFAALLAAFGWPGERSLSSSEHQIVVSWWALVAGLDTLEMVETGLTATEALAALDAESSMALFQPERGEDAPVQILGSLEAGGERFAALWLLGMSDDRWPRPPQPNPFLPRAFQKEHLMPRSSSLREHEFAQRLTGELLGAAPVVVVSHARRDGDVALRPSPLIQGIVAADATEEPPLEPMEWDADRPGLEVITGDGAVPLVGAGPFSGSSGMLKAQSRCPFQAFARYRLKGETFPAAMIGLSPALRGQLTHQVLSRLLVPGFSMKQWRLLPEQGRRALIETACVRGMDAWIEDLAERQLPQGLLALEFRRQRALLGQWMAIEERRESDFTVMAVERSGSLSLHSLELRYRMDRVDRLDDEGFVIIDYKTGMARYGDWSGVRPRDPQMPLYALGLDDNLVALSYGMLSRKSKRFLGLAEREDILPGVATRIENGDPDGNVDFSVLKDHWRRVLKDLAESFVQGDARVMPLKGVCDQCDLDALCRVAERQDGGTS
ncbi:MAG: PD-(D/E)XK nuclease family protein [Magnetococcales bacterium]|nr:PD-(D/E)XK nuclease family protein [Magnetococcales bacterium]